MSLGFELSLCSVVCWCVVEVVVCYQAVFLAADLSGGALDGDSCQLFCRLAMQSTPPLTSQRFSALVQDFGNLARGEGTPDVLLAYEL